jgi:hypothetical protein
LNIYNFFYVYFPTFLFNRTQKVTVSDEEVKKSMGFFFTMQLAKKCGQIWKKKSSLGGLKKKISASSETK